MKDAQKELIPALRDKLILANIKINGTAVPIYTVVPDDMESYPYIKIESPRAEDYGCKDSNVQDIITDVIIVTKYEKRGSLVQVDYISNLVSQALQDSSLSMDSFYCCLMRVWSLEPKEEMDETGRRLVKTLRCRTITEEK